MTRFAHYLLLILTIFSSTSAFALVDISCFKYEPATVTLVGVLESKVYPGLPNFLSIESGDAPETGYFIELKPPICTITKEESWMLGHQRISEVQLAVSKLQYDQLATSIGGVISVKGSLFEAFNGHHHTPVLMDVKTFEGTEKPVSTATKNEKIIKPLPKVAKIKKPLKTVKSKVMVKKKPAILAKKNKATQAKKKKK